MLVVGNRDLACAAIHSTMNVLPYRTYETSLSEDEMLIFDFLSLWQDVPERALKRDAYPTHMNVRYSHALDGPELHESLHSLAGKGLVKSKVGEYFFKVPHIETCWSLTPLGGELWELERRPKWDKFCMDSIKSLRSGTALLTVISPNKGTAERFWDIATRANIWDLSFPSPRYWRIRRHELLSWRSFPELHVLAGKGLNSKKNTDWNLYEANQTWWRSITELERLHGR
jgi:hypothetical protein